MKHIPYGLYMKLSYVSYVITNSSTYTAICSSNLEKLKSFSLGKEAKCAFLSSQVKLDATNN